MAVVIGWSETGLYVDRQGIESASCIKALKALTAAWLCSLTAL